MKKIISILALSLLLITSVSAQKVIITSYADTLSGAQTKYYPVALVNGYTTYSFQAIYNHLTGSSDSAHIWFEGSVDGVAYHSISSAAYVPCTAIPGTTFCTVSFTAATANYIWLPASVGLPYVRAAVQHYATGTTTVKVLGYPVRTPK